MSTDTVRRVIVFDYFKTLATEEGGALWWSELERRVAAAGGSIIDELIEWFGALPLEHVEYSIDEASYCRWSDGRLDRVLSSSGLSEQECNRIRSVTLQERYVRTFNVFPEVPSLLQVLRERGVRVGVCSNWDWGLDRELAANGIADLIDFVVCSARVGYRKPHPKIFERAKEAAAVEPESIVFVGDDWNADIEGSRVAGFRPVHVERGAECRVVDHEGVPCIGDLRELLALTSN